MIAARLPRAVVLLSGGPPISLKVLYCLKELGIPADIIDIGSPSVVRHSRYRRHYLSIPGPCPGDEASEAEFVSALQYYIRQHAIEGVVPGDIPSTRVLHAVRERIDGVVTFPTSDVQTLEMLDDKWRFYRYLEEEGLPTPKGVLLEDVDEVSERVGSLTFPLVVKPLFGESGHGVVVVGRLEELKAYLRSESKHSEPPLLIQEYASGIDADISVLAVDGRIKCHVLHARRGGCTLEFMHNDMALKIAERIVERARFSGVANIDLRIDEVTGAVKVLECNPRFWYTLQASLWRGVNFVEQGFRAVSGDMAVVDTPTEGKYHLHGCLLKTMLWHPGRWSDIQPYNWRGLMQALSDPGPFLRR